MLIGLRRLVISAAIFLATAMAITLVDASPALNVREDQAGSDVTEASASGGQQDAPDPSPGGDTADRQPTGDYRTFFQDDLFIGDSLTQGLAFYDLLDGSAVVARLGLNLATAGDEVDQENISNHKNIYILFGENDLTYYSSNQQLIDSYAELVEEIRAKAPQSEIYVQSILPVDQKAEGGNPQFSNARREELNAGLAAMAARDGVRYLDLASVFKNRSDLYQPDGIHLQPEFYKLWLDYLEENAG